MMAVLYALICAVSILTVGAYICRLDWLEFRKHHPGAIIFHVAMLACAAAAGVSAYEKSTGLMEASGLVAALSWLWLSMPSWRYGPPSSLSKPVPIDPKSWPEITGGKK